MYNVDSGSMTYEIRSSNDNHRGNSHHSDTDSGTDNHSH